MKVTLQSLNLFNDAWERRESRKSNQNSKLRPVNVTLAYITEILIWQSCSTARHRLPRHVLQQAQQPHMQDFRA